MKKSVTLILLLICLLLTSCSCKHEWTEADCVNPQVCAKCSETGAAALGHSWSAATCTEPERCSRCGNIQGNPLGHSFGEWAFAETEMTHACSRCGYSEAAPLDRALQLEPMLSGLWEFYGLTVEDTFYPAYNLPIPGDCLTFSSDRSVTGTMDQKPFTGTWEFLEYQEKDEERLYYFQVSGDDNRNIQMLYADSPENDILCCFFANDTQVLLSRNNATASTILGSWGADAGSAIYSLTFCEDRTVTGNLGVPFSGTWQLLPIRDIGSDFSKYAQFCGMYIRYFLDGEEQVLSATVYPPATYGEAAGEFAADSISLTLNDQRYTFEAMTPEELDAQSAAKTAGPNMLVGTWSSMYWRNFAVSPKQDNLALDYSVTFLSDGTFTASVGEERSGTWMFDDFQVHGNQTVYSYYLYIDGDNYPYDMELKCIDDHVPELSIESRSSVPGSRRMLFLNRRTSETDQAIRKLIGTWNSVSVESRLSDGTYSTDSVLDYQFSFFEDGTFSGNDGTERKGTWIYERTRDETVHQFDLFLNDNPGAPYASIIIYDHSDSGDRPSVDYQINTEENGNRTISLISYSPEDLEMSRQGPAYILGKWVSDSDDYFITIHDDGTFTANLDTIIQGTWSFRQYTPESGYSYHFTFPGQRQYCDKTLYAFPNECEISFRIATDDDETFYRMRRD